MKDSSVLCSRSVLWPDRCQTFSLQSCHLFCRHRFLTRPALAWRQQTLTSRKNSICKQVLDRSSLPRLRCRHRPRRTPCCSTQQPDHPEGLNYLYKVYACGSFVERSWRFGLPLLLAGIPGGFQTVALVGFISPLSVALFGPLVGQTLDNTPRQRGLTAVVILQTICIFASGLVMLWAYRLAPGVRLQQTPMFLLLLVLCMMERLSAFASDVAIERDWVSQLAGHSNLIALANSNASLRRADQLCDMTGSLAFGWCLTQYGAATTLGVASCILVACLPLELYFIRKVSGTAPQHFTHRRSPSRPPPSARPRRTLHPLSKLAASGQRTLDTWRLYLRQPILLASGAYVMLYFNAVLSPGGLMTAFLASRGLTGTAAAIFRSSCAVMGFVGTWAGRHLISGLGLLNAGIVAITFQAGVLSLAACLYSRFLAQPAGAVGSSGLAGQVVAGAPLVILLFCALLVLSRIGVWAFDMVDAQIFQTVVPPQEAASASATEFALCSMSELLMLGVAAIASDPSMFGMLVSLSLGAVIAAACVYTFWVTCTDAKQIVAGATQMHITAAAAA